MRAVHQRGRTILPATQENMTACSASRFEGRTRSSAPLIGREFHHAVMRRVDAIILEPSAVAQIAGTEDQNSATVGDPAENPL